MSLVDSLISFFSRPQAETAEDVPEGLCGNCWGHYEYDGKIREIARDRQIDVNHNLERRAFIQDFVVTHVDGIRLREDAEHRLTCANCAQHA